MTFFYLQSIDLNLAHFLVTIMFVLINQNGLPGLSPSGPSYTAFLLSGWS